MRKNILAIAAVMCLTSSAAHAADAVSVAAPKAKGPSIVTSLKKQIKKPFRLMATTGKILFSTGVVLCAAAEAKLK